MNLDKRLRKKILFASKQESSRSFSKEFLQKQFLDSVLTGLKYENIRNELQPFLKERVLEDEKLLEYLTFTMIDKTEKHKKFSNSPKKTDVKNFN